MYISKRNTDIVRKLRHVLLCQQYLIFWPWLPLGLGSALSTQMNEGKLIHGPTYIIQACNPMEPMNADDLLREVTYLEESTALGYLLRYEWVSNQVIKMVETKTKVRDHWTHCLLIPRRRRTTSTSTRCKREWVPHSDSVLTESDYMIKQNDTDQRECNDSVLLDRSGRMN